MIERIRNFLYNVGIQGKRVAFAIKTRYDYTVWWLIEQIEKDIVSVKRSYRAVKESVFTKLRRWKYKIERYWRTAVGFCLHYLSEIVFFLHITLASGLIIWGIEVLLSSIFPQITVWRILVGIYLILWCGLVYLKEIFKLGLYLDQ